MAEAYPVDPHQKKNWLQWGPYLSERQWGTVREDYSADGNAWEYFSHDQARSRAYRWGEDGLAGISDQHQKLCFSIALWNEKDPLLKERLFGLTNGEGNHGEDVKEYYYYLDNTPTHSYMKWLYKYPQHAYPYLDLVNENARRKSYPYSWEYELMDTGAFQDDKYFDVRVEYAKAAPEDILIQVSITNHGPDVAPVHIIPTLLYRNTWTWLNEPPPAVLSGKMQNGYSTIQALKADASCSDMMLYCEGTNELLFVNNETNNERLFGSANKTAFVKDGIHDYLISGRNTVDPGLTGTKAGVHYRFDIAPGMTQVIRLRLSSDPALAGPFDPAFDAVFADRIADANQFYEDLAPAALSAEQKMIQRQAYAGMLWSKQFYNFVVSDWLAGDPAGPMPPPGRNRNMDWPHMYACGVISMPDKWEYPWFAAWDLCFHTVVFARLDIHFAKRQLKLLLHEWYMSPDGGAPAYEWSFSDINPPLQAWAALQLFTIEKEMTGGDGDACFLSDVFQHCLMNFTWWVNREDEEGNNLFEGGFLGLDNISVINRSNLSDFEKEIGCKVSLMQSDGTSWMGMFCLNMMQIALELSRLGRPEYSHFVSKFFQHFVFVADAINNVHEKTNGAVDIWDKDDGFYYDYLKIDQDPVTYASIRLRSLVGIIALFPVIQMDLNAVEPAVSTELRLRMDWFWKQHPELLRKVKIVKPGNELVPPDPGSALPAAESINNSSEYLFSFVDSDRLKIILSKVLDENEFLSPYGIRSISKVYFNNPYTLEVDGHRFTEDYEPAESSTGVFGGNSNWRGPVWFPINFLFIETLKNYHAFLGESFTVEYPAGSGKFSHLKDIANDLSKRLISLFEKNDKANGYRPVHGGNKVFQEHPDWQNLLLFYEYFHGDNGAGLGASHQTGWTGLVAELLNRIN